MDRAASWSEVASLPVQVPEGMEAAKVVERARQEERGENDEGLSQIVQMLLLAEGLAFVGTSTSNLGALVAKLMAFGDPSPIALDVSCVGLQSMRNSSGEVWPLAWPAEDTRRCARRPRRRS
jgi:hypothetical protein